MKVHLIHCLISDVILDVADKREIELHPRFMYFLLYIHL